MKTIVFTQRQMEIGCCLVNGISVKEIANQFNISIATVRAHQKMIQKKLSTRNAYQTGYQLATFLNLEAQKLKIYL